MSRQREIDDEGELAAEVGMAKRECRNALLNLELWEFPERMQPWAVKWRSVGDEDLNHALIGECLEDLKLSAALLDSNPAEAMRMLDECRRKAVEDVLGRMDFEAIVKAISEQECAA